MKQIFTLFLTYLCINIAVASDDEAAGGGGALQARSDDSKKNMTWAELMMEVDRREAAFQADIAAAATTYLRFLISGESDYEEGGLDNSVTSILCKAGKYAAQHIERQLMTLLPADTHSLDIPTTRAVYLRHVIPFALTPDYLASRMQDVIGMDGGIVRPDILAHFKWRVIISRDGSLTEDEVREFHGQYQSADEALAEGSSEKPFVIMNAEEPFPEGLDGYLREYPDVTLVAAFSGTAIGDNWNVPSSVKKLDVVGERVESIGDGFLQRYPRRGLPPGSEAITLSLRGLPHVKRIGHDFLCFREVRGVAYHPNERGIISGRVDTMLELQLLDAGNLLITNKIKRKVARELKDGTPFTHCSSTDRSSPEGYIHSNRSVKLVRALSPKSIDILP